MARGADAGEVTLVVAQQDGDSTPKSSRIAHMIKALIESHNHISLLIATAYSLTKN
jgi:hypothetical protein